MAKKNEKRTEIVPLRQVMDRLFEESFLDPFSVFRTIDREPLALSFPKVDVSETEKEIEVKADVPGIEPDKINVEVSDEDVRISGEYESKKEEKRKTHYRLERQSGSFERLIPLPSKVVSDQAKAEIKDGVLEIVAPKQEISQKKVKVKVNKK